MLVLHLITKYNYSKKITLVNLQKIKTHYESYYKRDSESNYTKI
jgi:hypothetical protein